MKARHATGFGQNIYSIADDDGRKVRITSGCGAPLDLSRQPVQSVDQAPDGGRDQPFRSRKRRLGSNGSIRFEPVFHFSQQGVTHVEMSQFGGPADRACRDARPRPSASHRLKTQRGLVQFIETKRFDKPIGRHREHHLIANSRSSSWDSGQSFFPVDFARTPPQ